MSDIAASSELFALPLFETRKAATQPLRLGLSASAALHVSLLAAGWLLTQLPHAPDEAELESIAVDIISVENFASNEPSTVVTEATATLVSSGAEAAEPVEIAALEPAEPVAPSESPTAVSPAAVQPAPPAAAPVLETAEAVAVPSAALLVAEPVGAALVEALIPEVTAVTATEVAATLAPAELPPNPESPPLPVHTSTLEELAPVLETASPLSLAPRPPETVAPVETAMLETAEPIESEAEIVPVPRPRITRQPVAPDPEPEPQAEQPEKQPPAKQPAEKPAEKPAKKPAKVKQQASLGNGGAADADSSASAASGAKGKSSSGGNAAATKYPGLVHSKVTRAARYPAKARGVDGEAVVTFTVGADGRVLKVALARSSGNAVLDDAALAAVERAAPFPPIPEAAGRSSWSFTVPLMFNK